jgi:hypothetical protein
MMKLSTSTRKLTALVAASSAAFGLGFTALSISAAHADPTYGSIAKPIVAVGSNTIEDLFDQYSGLAPSAGTTLKGTSTFHHLTPLNDPTTAEQVYSFDAVNPSTGAVGDCIVSKPGGPAFARPNGSGDGRKALSDAIDGTLWSKTTNTSCSGTYNVTGSIDFSRSSSAPGSTPVGTGLTWVDFGRDAIAPAFYGNGLDATQLSIVQQQLTKAEMTTLYSNTNATPGKLTVTDTGGSGESVTLYAELPQAGSGTESTWLTDIGGTQAPAEAAATASGCFPAGGIEENGADAFYTAATTLCNGGAGVPVGSAAVEPFSVGSWISQANGFAQDRSSVGRSHGVDLSNLDGDAGASPAIPYVGSPGSETPNSTYYAAFYGRDLFVIVPFKALNGGPGQFNAVEQRIFGKGTAPGSGAICSAPYNTTTLNNFGFSSPSVACGTETNTATTDGTGA